MKKGDVFEASVLDLSSAGQGVVKHPDGMTCFVSGVWLGERGVFRIVEIKKRFARAIVLELHETSEARTVPSCVYAEQNITVAFRADGAERAPRTQESQSHTKSHAKSHAKSHSNSHAVKQGQCGGCPWMFVNYDAQLKAKQTRIEHAIQRINPDWRARVKPIQASPKPLAYRNRTQLKSDGQRIGFLAAGSHQLIDITQCDVLEETLQHQLSALRAQLPQTHWRPKSKKHKWVTLDLDTETPEHTVSINKRLPFKQANDDQNAYMQAWLGSTFDELIQTLDHGRSERKNDHAQIHSDTQIPIKVVELFCGSGNFTSIIASRPRISIVAAECNHIAIEHLKQLNLKNVEAHVVNLFDVAEFNRFLKRCKGVDVLFLDPPRDGMKVKAGLFTENHMPKYIVYISCDLATFCRDLIEFHDKGFRLHTLQPLDLFPQTAHVELLAILERA